MDTAPVVIGIGDIQQKDNFDNLDEALVLMNRLLRQRLMIAATKISLTTLMRSEFPKDIGNIEILVNG